MYTKDFISYNIQQHLGYIVNKPTKWNLIAIPVDTRWFDIRMRRRRYVGRAGDVERVTVTYCTCQRIDADNGLSQHDNVIV